MINNPNLYNISTGAAYTSCTVTNIVATVSSDGMTISAEIPADLDVDSIYSMCFYWSSGSAYQIYRMYDFYTSMMLVKLVRGGEDLENMVTRIYYAIMSLGSGYNVTVTLSKLFVVAGSSMDNGNWNRVSYKDNILSMQLVSGECAALNSDTVYTATFSSTNPGLQIYHYV